MEQNITRVGVWDQGSVKVRVESLVVSENEIKKYNEFDESISCCVIPECGVTKNEGYPHPTLIKKHKYDERRSWGHVSCSMYDAGHSVDMLCWSSIPVKKSPFA